METFRIADVGGVLGVHVLVYFIGAVRRGLKTCSYSALPSRFSGEWQPDSTCPVDMSRLGGQAAPVARYGVASVLSHQIACFDGVCPSDSTFSVHLCSPGGL